MKITMCNSALIREVLLPLHDWTGRGPGVQPQQIIHLYTNRIRRGKVDNSDCTQGSYREWRWVTQFQIKYLKKGKWLSYDKADGSQVYFDQVPVLFSYSFFTQQPFLDIISLHPDVK